MAGTARAVAVAAVAGALLAGCVAPPDVDASPGTTTPPSAEPGLSADTEPTRPAEHIEPTADDVRSAGTAVGVGERTVLHALAADGAAMATSVDDDGAVTVLRVDAAASGVPVAVVLAAPAGASLDVQDDGSLVVLAGDGTLVGGAARPAAAADGGRATVALVADDLARVRTDDGALEVRVAARALAGAEWGEREGGRSLAVAPTPWARDAGQAGEVAVWTELVAAVPEADTPVMRDQLTCHVLGAPDKETWNLEPWRPDVGLFGILAAACNPA